MKIKLRAVVTASRFGSGNTELRRKGVIRKPATMPITRTGWILT